METQRGRIEYEKDFHNRRISQEEQNSRASQSKYYFGTEKYSEGLRQLIREKARQKTVLEIGCFAGQYLMNYAADARQAYGIDLSDESVRKLQDTIAAAKITNCEVVCGDAHNLPFQDDTMDVVYGFGILHHLNFEKAVLEARRVLRPTGVALFMEPLGTNPAINLYRRMTPRVRSPYETPLSMENLAFISRYFESANFEFYGGLSVSSGFLGQGLWARHIRSVFYKWDDAIFNVRAFHRFAWCVNIVAVK